MKTSWSFHGRTTPFASSCTKPSCVKSPRIHHGRAVSILRKWPVPRISLISLMEYFFSLRNVEKRVENIRASGRTRSRQIDVSVSRIRRSLRIVNEEVTKGRNRVEVFSSLWLLASLEIPPPPPSSSSSSFFTRSNWTIRGILPIVAYDKCQMLIIFPERNSIYLWTDSKTEYNI